jgi:hypothetical protein
LFDERQKQEEGNRVLPRLAAGDKYEWPIVKGFADRNLRYMVHSHMEYHELQNAQRAVAHSEINNHKFGKLPVSEFGNKSKSCIDTINQNII